MARHQQPTWLGSIDDRLHEVFEALAAARPLESTQELCRSLLTDCTAGPHKNSDGPFECVPPRFIRYGWDVKALQHFDFVCTPGLPAFGVHFGPTENDLRGEKGHYFAEAFKLMFEFVASPLPRDTLATDLKELLAIYLKLRGRKPSLRSTTLTVDIKGLCLTFNGKQYDQVKSEKALRWVNVLNEHCGDWIKATELHTYDENLGRVRTTQLKKFLPRPVRNLIESQAGIGSRLKRR